ncbi:hypothetical protein V7166_18360, partial [Bacillus thuringiensis]
KIFSLHTNDLDYKFGSSELKKWLIQQQIIEVDNF